ncbi:hypothetical protein [Pseudoduganella lutea]|uniref:Uncharacterized protein n=1 Tax=Pseudoduganella lutea TaxID=321985 RepID=A0A4P6L4A5_9BURK|nr:hypothetical protein [Pseudoduganella lutea]QBE66420.1 hypothetical protein EWM63_28475 [Pseudoduganella lutea]
MAKRLARAKQASPMRDTPDDEVAKAAKLAQAELSFPKTAEGVARASKTSHRFADCAARASAWMAAVYLRDPVAENPFAGLAREQLSTVVHDQSGAFNLPERAAASMQVRSDELRWREAMHAKLDRARSEGGSLGGLFREALAHFNELPRAERAQYPKVHAAGLENLIKFASGATGGAGGTTARNDVSLDIAQALGGPLPGETGEFERACGIASYPRITAPTPYVSTPCLCNPSCRPASEDGGR